MVCRRTWLEVDLGAMVFNFHSLRKRIGQGVEVIAVVKDDGYGCGAREVCRTLDREGVRFFGVANLQEAVKLRRGGIKGKLLVLGSIFEEEALKVVEYDITQTLCSLSLAKRLSQVAISKGKQAFVHVKVDTGMARVGISPSEVLGFMKKLKKLANLQVEGFWTHFASADEDEAFTLKQLKMFKRIIEDLKKEGISIPYYHIANSAAVLRYPQSFFNMVRPGLIIYGVYPPSFSLRPISLKPVITWRTRVIFLKKVPPGTSISYGRTYVTDKETCIATIPVGYGDGYSRQLSNRGEVLLHGKRVPIAGRICMDQFMINVGDMEGVKVGDEVVLIGKQGEEEIRVEEIAERIDTVPHEVLTSIRNRVPRIYKSDGLS